MEIKKYIVNNFVQLVVVVLVIILILDRCGSSGKATSVGKADTVYFVTKEIHRDTIHEKPQIIKTIPYEVKSTDTKYIPSKSPDSLLRQFEELRAELLAKNIYEKTYPIDTLGSVIIKDTVSNNTITGRSLSYNLVIPKVREQITLPYTPKNQFFIGGGISGNQLQPIQQFNVGVLFKNKKDQIYGITTGLNINGQVTYGIQSYWKIKLKK